MKLNGYTFSPEQLRGRWKTLVSSYKWVKDYEEKSGQGTRKHECSADLAFLDKSADVVPTVVILSSQDTFSARKMIRQNDTISQMPNNQRKNYETDCDAAFTRYLVIISASTT